MKFFWCLVFLSLSMFLKDGSCQRTKSPLSPGVAGNFYRHYYDETQAPTVNPVNYYSGQYYPQAYPQPPPIYSPRYNPAESWDDHIPKIIPQPIPAPYPYNYWGQRPHGFLNARTNHCTWCGSPKSAGN